MSLYVSGHLQKYHLLLMVIFEYTRKDVLDKWFNTSNANMHVVLNHSLQERIVPMLDENYTSSFLVDYVRVYKKG